MHASHRIRLASRCASAWSVSGGNQSDMRLPQRGQEVSSSTVAVCSWGVFIIIVRQGSGQAMGRPLAVRCVSAATPTSLCRKRSE